MEKYTFVLLCGYRSETFTCRRSEFRSKIADAFIALQIGPDSPPPIIKLSWMASGKTLNFPIRWECVTDYYDSLVREYWREIESKRPPPPIGPRAGLSQR